MQITEENFKEYFHAADGKHKPERGECLARWRATADFVDGWVKRNVIEMLATNKVGAETALKVMQNLVRATQKDSVKVLLEMAKDLRKEGVDKVVEKPYRFTVEQFYWTKKEYVPDDIHWEVINMTDLRDLGSKNADDPEAVLQQSDHGFWLGEMEQVQNPDNQVH
jgi:hypothetical protein